MELKKEKEILEKVTGRRMMGIRMHYLRFSVPYTWRILSELGFKYDTTFGYADMPGFRNSVCYPFNPYDLILNKELDILEIPLTIMDSSLFSIGYSKAWAIIEKLVENTEKNNGLITILWHNNTFDEINYGEWSRLYEKILSYLKEKKAWITNAEDIFRNWVN
jgi:peptidoglycan/xylan/chitin deacetylase (PgdA/CDA1 family)